MLIECRYVADRLYFRCRVALSPSFTVNSQDPAGCPCPLNSTLCAAQVSTRCFLYPVHTSGAFLLTPSLSASIYLVRIADKLELNFALTWPDWKSFSQVNLRLLARQYDLAARLLTACDTDSPLTAEERVRTCLSFRMLVSSTELACCSLACVSRP